MRVLVTICLMLLIFTQCERKHTYVDPQLIIGNWVLEQEQEEILYPVLEFRRDSLVTFYTGRGDTVQYYSYYITGDTLVMGDVNGGVYKNTIKTLTESKLVFYTLLEFYTPQAYSRFH